MTQKPRKHAVDPHNGGSAPLHHCPARVRKAGRLSSRCSPGYNEMPAYAARFEPVEPADGAALNGNRLLDILRNLP